MEPKNKTKQKTNSQKEIRRKHQFFVVFLFCFVFHKTHKKKREKTHKKHEMSFFVCVCVVYQAHYNGALGLLCVCIWGGGGGVSCHICFLQTIRDEFFSPVFHTCPEREHQTPKSWQLSGSCRCLCPKRGSEWSSPSGHENSEAVAAFRKLQVPVSKARQ